MATKAKTKFELKAGSKIRTSDDTGTESDLVWTIDKITKNVLELSNTNGDFHKVHTSRVVCVVDGKNEICNPNFQTTLTKSEKVTGKTQKVTPKKDASPVKANFKELAKTGEVWTKDIDFDHKEIVTQAHCVVGKDGKSFTVFNTYDGAYGKKGATGTTYKISGIKALIRKRKQLEKKGYELAYQNKELEQYIEDNS